MQKLAWRIPGPGLLQEAWPPPKQGALTPAPAPGLPHVGGDGKVRRNKRGLPSQAALGFSPNSPARLLGSPCGLGDKVDLSARWCSQLQGGNGCGPLSTRTDRRMDVQIK